MFSKQLPLIGFDFFFLFRATDRTGCYSALSIFVLVNFAPNCTTLQAVLDVLGHRRRLTMGGGAEAQGEGNEMIIIEQRNEKDVKYRRPEAPSREG